MPLTGVDNAISILTDNSGAQEMCWWAKDGYISGTTTVVPSLGTSAGSLWLWSGQRPVYGDIPGAASIPTRTTAGALGQTNATGGRTKYITSFGCGARYQGGLYIADRLAHMGGLDGTLSTAQTVNLTAGRYTSATEAIGNEIWIEIYSTIGASSRTITASYYNETGATGRTTIARAIGSAAAGNNQIGRFIRLPLQQGDLGVTYVDTITLSSSTGTAGNFGVTIVKTLTGLSRSIAASGIIRNYLFDQFTPIPIKDDACLFFWQVGLNTLPIAFGHVQFIEA